ncbi:hypothetical protein MSM1_04500 [Mycobacterium sp. SM1]|uniref:hypothetical protein n=1 Tax=Mycobacterium sp. SM1 TaxID=2816243 RepID=UPI001BD07E71|nr:hypothetical protein [Mycobacterium sp. SM1]MBS4727639.1 hypothetical protein [Mycobacterium sp. SM1]
MTDPTRVGERVEVVDAGVKSDIRGLVTAARTVLLEWMNARKKGLTAASSARWANAIIAANDDRVRRARDAQYRHVAGLRAPIATIEARLAPQ